MPFLPGDSLLFMQVRWLRQQVQWTPWVHPESYCLLRRYWVITRQLPYRAATLARVYLKSTHVLSISNI